MRPAVRVEQLRDRHDATGLVVARLEARQRLDESVALGRGRVSRRTLAQRRRGSSEQRRGRAQKSYTIRIEGPLAQLERLCHQLRAGHDLGQG